MDTLLLSRLQFAANISFHILFPAVSIGLAWLLLFFRWRWLKTRDHSWILAYRFWTKVFALTFALGVVSGITMSFQFGTNWPGFMERVGSVAGPLLGYEVLTAFFLEAGFLGIMLFGATRVTDRVHLFSALMVAIGTSISAFWILALNSWMQTPAGYWIDAQGVFHVSSWLEVIFNPSFPFRFLHMVIASFLTVAFLMAGLSAWQFLHGTNDTATPKVLKTAIPLAAILVPIQILIGDQHGLNTLEHNPAKIAAVEALWSTEQGAPLVLFAVPNERKQRNDYAVEVPHVASLILTHQWNGTLQGMRDLPQHPPSKVPFYSFRIMVGIGMLMLIVSWVSWYYLRRYQKKNKPFPVWLLRVLSLMTVSGWVAVLAGWYVTEVGRQPWIVNGLILTKDVVTHQPREHVELTLALYLLLYVFLTWAYLRVIKSMAEKSSKTEALPVYTNSGELVVNVDNEGIVAQAKLPDSDRSQPTGAKS